MCARLYRCIVLAAVGLRTYPFGSRRVAWRGLVDCTIGFVRGLLFAIPASPLAQRWSIIGGNISVVTVGVTCTIFIFDPLIAAAAVCALAIGVMFWMRCLHPPSGSIALTTMLEGDNPRNGLSLCINASSIEFGVAA
jgi:CBS-domain-containing membrane protein